MNTRWTALAGIVVLVAAVVAVALVATGAVEGYDPENANPPEAWADWMEEGGAAAWFGALAAVAGASLMLFFAGLAEVARSREASPSASTLMATSGALWGAALIGSGALLYLAGETAGYLEYPAGGLTMYMLAGLPTPGGPFAALPAIVALSAWLSVRDIGWPRWMSLLPLVASALFALAIIPIWPILALGAVGLLVLLAWLVAVSVRLLRA